MPLPPQVRSSSLSIGATTPRQCPKPSAAPERGAIKTLPERAPAPFRGVVYDVPNAAADQFWDRLLGLLRVGDVLRLDQDRDRPTQPVLHVYADGTRVASLRIPTPSTGAA